MFTDPTAKVKAAAFEMRGDFNLARGEAVRRNQDILVDFLFTACNKADVDSGACTVVCRKTLDLDKTEAEKKASFDACFSDTGSNQGYVICFDEDEDNSCDGEVSATTPAEDIEAKIIKTVLFQDAIQYYKFDATLPSSPTGSTPSSAPDGVALASNNGITFGEIAPTGDDFLYMNSNGTSNKKGSVVIYLPKDGDPATLTVKGKPYAVVVDSESTGRVLLDRWTRDKDGNWFWGKK
jgi:hypothetical protein